MDESSPYHRLVKQRRETTRRRLTEDAEFKEHVDKTYSDIQNKKDTDMAEHSAKFQREEIELQEREDTEMSEMETRHCQELQDLTAGQELETAERQRLHDSAMSKLSDEQTSALEKLQNYYGEEEDKARVKIESLASILKTNRDAEDADLSRQLLEALDEENDQTIEVESPGVSVSNTGQSLLSITNLKARLESSSSEQSPTRGSAQQSPQTPQSHLRVSSQVTPTKRLMAESPCENRPPPSMRRVVSENLRPGAAEDILTSSSPPASSRLFVSPKAQSSKSSDLHPGSPSRPMSISSAPSQSTAQGSFPTTQLANAQANYSQVNREKYQADRTNPRSPADRSQILSTPCRPIRAATASRSKLASPFRPVNQNRSFSANTPVASPSSSSQQGSPPSSTKQCRPVCANFEITEVRYNNAGGTFLPLHQLYHPRKVILGRSRKLTQSFRRWLLSLDPWR